MKENKKLIARGNLVFIKAADSAHVFNTTTLAEYLGIDYVRLQ